MRKIVLILTLLALLTLRVSAQELLEQEAEILGTQTLEDGLDGEARSMLDGVSPSGTADFGKELTRMLGRAVSGLETPLHAALRTGCMLLAVVLLPINAERSTLSTYFDEMGSQITTVETALQERMDARASADPWDNTLAYAYADDVFHGYLYAVPAGMGIEFDWNTYIADPEETIYSRYAMVNHGTDAEARLLADGWQEVISTEDLIVYERPDTQ